MDTRRAWTPGLWGFVSGIAWLSAHADQVTICGSEPGMRRISVHEHEHDCDATYSRQQPGTEKALWNSQSSPGSCAQHAETLKRKLQAGGLTCRDFLALASGPQRAATDAELTVLRKLPGYKQLQSASVAPVSVALGARRRSGWVYVHDTSSNCGVRPSQTCSRALVLLPESAAEMPQLAVDVAGGELFVSTRNDDWVEILHLWEGSCDSTPGGPRKVEVTLWQHSGQWFQPGDPVWLPACPKRE